MEPTLSRSIPSEPEALLSDEALLLLCHGGQLDAFREIIRRYQEPMFQFLFHMLDSEQDAERLAVEVFVRAWRSATRNNIRSSVVVWLYRIAVRVVRDCYARRRAQPREEPQEGSGRLAAGKKHPAMGKLLLITQEDRVKALRESLNRLGDTERVIWVLYWLQDRPLREVAAIIRKPYFLVRLAWNRLRRRMRTQMNRFEHAHSAF